MRVTIIADASYCPDTKAAGYGYWIASERGKRGGGGPLRSPIDGSGAAEMMALCNALTVAINAKLVLEGDFVLLQTDCQSALYAFEGLRNHSMTRHEREACVALRELQHANKLKFGFRHVKGHSNRAEARYITNNRCDERAKEGMRFARRAMRGGGSGK